MLLRGDTAGYGKLPETPSHLGGAAAAAEGLLNSSFPESVRECVPPGFTSRSIVLPVHTVLISQLSSIRVNRG
eukprot:756424-Pelagomonas_calceolata.AAC.8